MTKPPARQRRALPILPCPASWDEMRPSAVGRSCAHCEREVHDLEALTETEVHTLLDASSQRCVRVPHRAGRPQLASGLAASVLVVALSGCAGPMAAEAEPGPSSRQPLVELGDEPGGERSLQGLIRTAKGEPIAGALVVLSSAALPATRERMSDRRGRYAFDELPAGLYTIEVLAGEAHTVKQIELAEGSCMRANFTLDPGAKLEITIGMVSIDRGLGTDPSSGFKASETVWLPDGS